MLSTMVATMCKEASIQVIELMKVAETEEKSPVLS